MGRGENDANTKKKRRSALTPEDLDISNSEKVVPIEEGRFVIASDTDSAKKAAKAVESGAVPSTAPTGGGQGGSAQPTTAPPHQPAGQPESTPAQSTKLTERSVKEWQEKKLTEIGSNYGFRITAKSERNVGHQQMYSDDVGTVFDGLLLWYAQQLDRETPVEDVLGILLTESNVRIRFPVKTLTELLMSHDLGPDDTISDLVSEVCDETGFVFPPDRTGTTFTEDD